MGDGGEDGDVNNADNIDDHPVIVTGAADGNILFWYQTAIEPDSSDEETEDEDDRYRATLKWWDSSGTLVRVQKGKKGTDKQGKPKQFPIHPGGVYGIQLVPETNHILTCGKRGNIILWDLITEEG